MFVAQDSLASALADCSDASLGINTGCEASAYPTCGGTCPGDGVCYAGFGSCTCVSPSSPCGGTSPLCNGTCSDAYPACGGGASCDGGGVCQPVTVSGVFDTCVCAVPAPCDASCGGYSCGPGEASGCSCTPP